MKIFTSEERKFIADNLSTAPAVLMLQASRYPDLPIPELVKQIQARQKAAAKLPAWAANLELLFPVALSVEQSSSETTAAYKASLISGKLLVDLTGGFGADSFFFSKAFEQVVHVEQQAALSEVARYNFAQLGADNIEAVNTTAEAFLEAFTGGADVFFLDPARRGEYAEKVHLLQDCEPDVLRLLPLLLQKAKAVLLKTSPMLDIELAISQLGKVSQVWVVAVNNECKEVLYLIEDKETEQVQYTAVNLQPDNVAQSLHFTRAAEEAAIPAYTDPQRYIYEPNAAIMKAGAYRYLAQQLHLGKLHPNSHLYTSEQLVADFPGRSFRCTAVSRYNRKELLAKLPAKKANITVRNFQESVAAIRAKTGIKEGGAQYLFFTTDRHQKPVVLFCEKV